MKKYIIILTIGICLLGVFMKYSKPDISANDSEAFDYVQWGKALKKDAVIIDAKDSLQGQASSSETSSATHDSDAIIYKGNDIDIRESEIQKSIAFYKASGLNAKEAEKEAVDYLMKFEALYADAIEKGYSVTDKEVDEYLNTMKNSLTSPETDEESKKEFRTVIAQFDSEENYWAYQKIICQKELPIQNYVGDLEEQYFQKHQDATDDDWLEYFEEYKSNLARQQNFHKVSK